MSEVLDALTTKDIYLIIGDQPYPSFEGGHQLQQAASRPANDDDEDEPPAAISLRQIERRVERCRIEQIEPRNPAVEPKNALRSETRIELQSTMATNVLYYSTYCLLNF